MDTKEAGRNTWAATASVDSDTYSGNWTGVPVIPRHPQPPEELRYYLPSELPQNRVETNATDLLLSTLSRPRQEASPGGSGAGGVRRAIWVRKSGAVCF